MSIRQTRTSPPVTSTRGRIFTAAGLISAAALAVYSNSFDGPFIYDDAPSILENSSIRQLWPPWDVFLPPGNGVTVSGRPVLNASLALNYALSGTAVWSYHLVNLFIHATAGLTLFGFLRRTLLQPALAPRFGADSLALAFTAALLWTVHPLQTESVTYVIQRAESLCGLFFLLALYCFARGSAPAASPGWFGGVLAACLLGMATKEIMALAPFLLFLYDRTFVAGTFRAALHARSRWHAAFLSTWLVVAACVFSTGGNRGGTVGFGTGIDWWAYGLTQFEAISRYLALSVWPYPLVFEYGTFWVTDLSTILAPSALVVALLAGTAVALVKWPPVGFAGAFFFVILAPTSLMPGTIQMIVEHRMYLPLAAVLALAILGLHTLLGPRSLPVLIAASIALGTATFIRNRDYRSEATLWSVTLAQRPNNPRVHYEFGVSLYKDGLISEAISHFEAVLRLDPGHPAAHNNLGHALAESGRHTQAIPHLEAAVRLRPGYDAAHYNLANALFKAGRSSEAIPHFLASLRTNPLQPKVRNNLGNALLQMNRLPEAIREFEVALSQDHHFAAAHNGLGIALLQSGHIKDAMAHFESALALNPSFSDAHSNLAVALSRLGRLSEAIDHARHALNLEPDSANARKNLEIFLTRQRAAAPPPE